MGRRYGSTMQEPTKNTLWAQIRDLREELEAERDRRERLEAKLKALVIEEGIVPRPRRKRKR